MTNSIVPSNFSRFDCNGLELVVDTSTGKAYASKSATARMLDVDEKTIRNQVNSSDNYSVITAQIPTAAGLRSSDLLPANVVFKLALKYNSPLAEAMGEAGANLYMLKLAGYELEIDRGLPKTYVEALEAHLESEKAKLILAAKVEILQEDNDRQAEIIDELFDYSSILRVAKFNNCDPKAFKWQDLKAASRVVKTEVKTAPCPNFGTRNLYSHEAWKLAYSSTRLPETTSIVNTIN